MADWKKVFENGPDLYEIEQSVYMFIETRKV